MNSDQDGVCVEAAKEKSFSEVKVRAGGNMRSGIRKYGDFPQRTVGSSKRERKVYLVNVCLLWVGRYPYYMPQRPYYGL